MIEEGEGKEEEEEEEGNVVLPLRTPTWSIMSRDPLVAIIDNGIIRHPTVLRHVHFRVIVIGRILSTPT